MIMDQPSAPVYGFLIFSISSRRPRTDFLAASDPGSMPIYADFLHQVGGRSRPCGRPWVRTGWRRSTINHRGEHSSSFSSLHSFSGHLMKATNSCTGRRSVNHPYIDQYGTECTHICRRNCIECPGRCSGSLNSCHDPYREGPCIS